MQLASHVFHHFRVRQLDRSSVCDELRSHTSPEMLQYSYVIEEDLSVVHGMNVQQILDFFANSP